MDKASDHRNTNLTVYAGTLLFILGLSTSLFFQNLNAEYFAMAGFSCMALLVLASWTGKFRSPGLTDLPVFAITTFWGWLVIATLISPVFYTSAGTLWTFAAFPAVAWAAMFMRPQASFQSITLKGLVATAVCLAIYACIQFFILEQSPRATFLNRNNFAALLIPVTLLALAAGLRNHHRKAAQASWLATMALFAFIIALIGSRGAITSLLIGVGFVFALCLWDAWPKKSLATVALTLFLAFAASNITTSGGLGKRLDSLKDPYSAGSTRFIIWNASLDLAMDAPWHGIGPGLYFLVYPKYRPDADLSSGFYVHNDYLQLLIEAGWPALLFVLLTILSLIWQMARALRVKAGGREDRLMLITLFSGLTCIAGHSLLTFNLYVLPILIVMGLLLGLLTNLLREMHTDTGPNHRDRPLSLHTRIVLTLLMVIPGLCLTDITRGTYYYTRGVELAQQGNYPDALEQLAHAIKSSPKLDLYPYAHTWVWLQNIQTTRQMPSDNEVARAYRYLERSEELNPFRPQPHIVRAMLYQSFPNSIELVKKGDDVSLPEMVEQEYRAALAKDPFFLEARFYLARFLLKQNRIEEGLSILEDGLQKQYSPSDLTTNYYRLTAEIRRITGDDQGYRELMEKMQEISRKQELYEQKKATLQVPRLF